MAAYYVDLDVHSQETMFVIQEEMGTMVGRGSVLTTQESLRACAATTASHPGRPWPENSPR